MIFSRSAPPYYVTENNKQTTYVTSVKEENDTLKRKGKDMEYLYLLICYN